MRSLLDSVRRFAKRRSAPVAITEADLEAITDSCGAPRDWLVLRGQEVVLLASPDEDEETLTCVLMKMSALIAAHNAGSGGTAQGSEEN